jgi:prephenate dehydratase
MHPGGDYRPHPTFEDVFAAVQDGQADLGVVPIDNGINGRVTDVHHLIPRYNLQVVGEHYLPVRHHLLAKHGVGLHEITSAASHAQALGQCRQFLRSHAIAPVETANTAVAAKMVAEGDDRTRAAIASIEAAEIYGLTALASDIANVHGNETRFFAVGRERADPAAPDGCIMILTFATQSIPAALFKALGGFATNSINMTKIDSYSVGGDFATAEFICEIEAAPGEARTQRALKELEFFSTSVRIVGVFTRSPRQTASAAS